MKLYDFTLATLKDISENNHPVDLGNTAISSRIFRISLSEVHWSFVYKVLKEAFGLPYKDWRISNRNSKWGWILNAGIGLLAIYENRGEWGIGIIGNIQRRSKALDEKAGYLRDAIISKTKETIISKRDLRENLSGGVIKNPYALYSSDANNFMIMSNKMKENYEIFDNRPTKLEDIELILGSKYCLLRAAFIFNYLALEGFINLLYLLLEKKGYQPEYCEKFSRNESILNKLLEFDHYCDDFDHQVFMYEDELFQAFKHIHKIRNNFVHANIVKGMESYLINKDGFELFHTNIEEIKYGIRNNPSRISNYDVIRGKRIIEKIKDKILSSLSIRIKEKFVYHHMDDYISYQINGNGQIEFGNLNEEELSKEFGKEYLELMSFGLDNEYYNIDEEEYFADYEEK